MLYFEFKHPNGTTVVLNEHTISNIWKKKKHDYSSINGVSIIIEKPLNELKQGSVFSFYHIQGTEEIELELIGCYVDLETQEIYNELGIEMPSQRIF